MHDPMTVAFDIKYPWRQKGSDYKPSFITIWHVDPEKDGSDDSCGWFKRAHHGDKDVVDRIKKRIAFDWDRTYTSDGDKQVYFCGLFCPNGDPHMSVHAIVLNLFQHAAWEYFNDGKNSGRAWKKSKQFMQDHLYEILLFAENPVDSLHDGIVGKFGTPPHREERIHQMATCIYGWILRADQKWWQHARWHVHHWKLQIHPLENFKRWAFSRCCKCGKGFKWGQSVCTNSWNGTGPLWFRSEKDIYHDDCNAPHRSPVASSESTCS